MGKQFMTAAAQRLTRGKRLAVSFLVGLMLAGCGRAITPHAPAVTMTPEPPDVTLVIGPAKPSPTPVVCTQNPLGLALSATVLPNGTVAISGEGFLPGEDTALVATAEVRYGNRSRSSTLEGDTGAEIGDDGRLYLEEGLWPLEGLETTWRIAIIHSRGVACVSVVVK
ncbi:MAG: hypothetical protein AB1449_05790 [Chloroflexota bacterium]